MRHRDQHPSDEELVSLADGELGPRSVAALQAHLGSCWACRARSRSLEAAIGDFLSARAVSVDVPLPPAAGGRALLGARLAQQRAASSNPPWARALPAAAAAGLVAVAMLFVFGGTVSAEGPRPKNSLTPGETRPVTLAEVCGVEEIQPIGPVSPEVRRMVFAEYGVTGAPAAAYEVDYLITPELGGANSIRNLWPQPYSARWNARVKDQLERRLHQLVCSGKLDLRTAQRDISRDWIGAWKKYVGRGDFPPAP